MAEEVAKTWLTKGDYAKLKGRAPSAVSNWIAEGKISKAALSGEGHRARIWVEQADRDLAIALDPSQQQSQAAPIDQVTPISAAPAPGTSDIERKRRADADAAELALEERRRRMNADAGKWIDAAEAERAWSEQLTRTVADMEIFVSTTLAGELADRFGIDRKAMTVAARDLFRDYRAAESDKAKAEAEDILESYSEAAE